MNVIDNYLHTHSCRKLDALLQTVHIQLIYSKSKRFLQGCPCNDKQPIENVIENCLKHVTHIPQLYGTMYIAKDRV